MKRRSKLFFSRVSSRIAILDYIDYDTADKSIRKNIAFRGPNVIILACAIIIASVGLNVNSIPVIIGAMLISPVMGPILGFGLGLGTEDRVLMKDSMKNFVVMVLISIIASSVYFILSPLNLENQSELLARTNPTIYDVLIALFGGFAGILETSRKDKGTVISGVAIATALMPPLCTIGYGISKLDIVFIGGALYLFLINSIFIALATFFAVKLFKFPNVEAADGKGRSKSRFLYLLILILFIVPSIFTAVNTVRENNFRIAVQNLYRKNIKMGNSFIFDYHVEASTVSFSLAGDPLTEEWERKFYSDAEELGIMREKITIVNATISREDISEAEIMKSVYEHYDREKAKLEDSIVRLNNRLTSYEASRIPVASIAKEIFAQYDNIFSVSIARGEAIAKYDMDDVELVIVYVKSLNPLDDTEHDQLERWLRVRLNNENVLVVNAE